METPCRTIVFTNARDETHMLEWIAHYIQLGFDTLFIFDHKSKTPIESLIKQPCHNIIVKRIDPNVKHMKSYLMATATKYAKGSYTWMLYVDADEFLYLKEHRTIQEFLKNYPSAQQIGVNWVMYGSNYLETEPEGGILESYTRSNTKMNQHIKSFVRPECVLGIINPHVYAIRNTQQSIHWTGTPLHIKEPYFYETTCPIEDATIYLAHYVYQSYDTYIHRKISIPRDDDITSFRKIIEKDEFHRRDNDIDNTMMLKYNRRNKEIIQQLTTKTIE